MSCLVAFLLEQLSPEGCFTPSTLMSTGMGVVDPKLAKGW